MAAMLIGTKYYQSITCFAFEWGFEQNSHSKMFFDWNANSENVTLKEVTNSEHASNTKVFNWKIKLRFQETWLQNAPSFYSTTLKHNFMIECAHMATTLALTVRFFGSKF